MKQQIIMHKKTASGYDEIYPDTSIDNILTNQTIANNMGISDIDGQTVLESVSATDKMISGYGTTSGTASAYTVNLVGKETMTPVDGMMIKVKFHVDSNEEPTINVNGSGAKNIFTENGLKVLGTIKTGAWVLLIKSDALDGWVLQGLCKRNKMYTEIITTSQSWTPPDGVKMVTVRLFGGGGGGGHMTVASFAVNKIPYAITIGAGGRGASYGNGGTGGTTSFGDLATANGGEGGRIGSASSRGGDGGTGGGGTVNGRGGHGSYGGGGGGGVYTRYDGNGGGGGNGGTYGGGGGGGSGRLYGGGGGGGSGRNGAYSGGSAFSHNGGGGGGYSGRGASAKSTRGGTGGQGEDTTSLSLEFTGTGTGGTSTAEGGGGGGGYGGNGGNARYGAGGGGGYGGNGGNGIDSASGGGGGYGGNGGNGGETYYLDGGSGGGGDDGAVWGYVHVDAVSGDGSEPADGAVRLGDGLQKVHGISVVEVMAASATAETVEVEPSWRAAVVMP